MIVMAAGAVTEALGGLVRGWSGIDPIPALVALPEARIGFDGRSVEHVMNGLAAKLRGLPLVWQQVGRGHAGGIVAIERAITSVGRGDVDLCLVGGVDSHLDPPYLGALLEQRRLHCESVRSGFSPGEGAGFVLLMSERVRRTRRWPSLAQLCTPGLADEPCSHDGEAATRGDGLRRAVAAACAGLRLPEESPGMVFCDINGERFRSEEWGFVLMRMAPQLRVPDYISAVGSWGDVGAATAPLLAILASQSWERGYASDSRALIWCASFGGQRGAMILEHPPAVSHQHGGNPWASV